MTSRKFERACSNAINGWLWEDTFCVDYQESVAMTVKEMRHIANIVRAHEGRAAGVVQEFSEEAERKDNE